MKMKNTSITEHNSMEIAQWMVKGKETDTINGDNGSREGIARLGGATQNIEQVKRIYLKINTYFYFRRATWAARGKASFDLVLQRG